jgi:penicillin-binding protein 2
MADPVTSRRLGYRVLWAALIMTAMVALLLPLHPGPGRFPPPDILLLITIAWVLRRPDYVPVGLIAAAFLMADFLFMRPPGLWAALVVLATEYLRAREAGWRDLPFLLEWAIVGAVLGAMTLAHAIAGGVFRRSADTWRHPSAPCDHDCGLSCRGGLDRPGGRTEKGRAGRSRPVGTQTVKRSPKDTEESVRRISRRGLFLGGSMLAFMGVLGTRMRQLQIEEADEFRLLAEENRINMRLIAPPRGVIYDRHGVPIAENAQNYRIIIVREDAGDVDDVVERLRSLVHLDEVDLERNLRELSRRSPFVPVTLADRLSWEDFTKVAVNAPALPGITPDVGLSRHYPMGGDFAHVVGYVGPVSDYDLERTPDPDPLLQIPKFQIGKVGVETRLEEELRGKAGTRRIEINAAGRVMRELGRDEGVPGADIQLTVDHALQNFLQTRMDGESAAAVVMDVRTGDLLALGSAPAFDPNKFVRGISGPDYRELMENIYRPLANKTVQGAYPPGSTFKMITALAGLEAGVIGPNETVYCPGFLSLGGRRFHCWRRGGHGQVDLDKSLVQSCDVYYYEVARRCGIDKIAEVANRFGLGIRHDLPMSAVTEGLIPSTEWKRNVRGETWRPGDSLNASIGQGYVLTSPLQLAVMTARLATGRDVVPRLIKSVNGVDVPEKRPPCSTLTRPIFRWCSARCTGYRMRRAALPADRASSPTAWNLPARQAPAKCATSPRPNGPAE